MRGALVLERRDVSGDALELGGLPQRLERLQLHLGVARRRQQPARVAEAAVLPLVRFLADLVAHEPQQRAHLLQILAGLVDGLGWMVVVAAELLQRIVDAAQGDAPDSARGRLAWLQAIRARWPRAVAVVRAEPGARRDCGSCPGDGGAYSDLGAAVGRNPGCCTQGTFAGARCRHCQGDTRR